MNKQELLENRLYNYKIVIERNNISETDKIGLRAKFCNSVEDMQREGYEVPEVYFTFYRRLRE